jgi:membrane protein YqaA with SNARE-associated domain
MKFGELIRRIQSGADRDSYGFITFLAGALDQWFPFIPLEPILIAGVIGRPLHWLRCPAWMATGCALGGTLLSESTRAYGMNFVGHYFPTVVAAALRPDVQAWFAKYGLWALSAMSASPIPHTPAILLAGAHSANPILVFGAISAGRLAKYLTVAWIVARAVRRLPET